MPITRREVCQKLLLVPAAAILSGCPDPPPDIPLFVVIFNSDKHPYDVNTSYDSFHRAFVPAGSISKPASATGKIGCPRNPADSFAVNVTNIDNNSIIATQSYSVNQIQQETGKDLAHSHVYVEIDVSDKKFVVVTIQAQPGGGG
jgi:hypothetical protein